MLMSQLWQWKAANEKSEEAYLWKKIALEIEPNTVVRVQKNTCSNVLKDFIYNNITKDK